MVFHRVFKKDAYKISLLCLLYLAKGNKITAKDMNGLKGFKMKLYYRLLKNMEKEGLVKPTTGKNKEYQITVSGINEIKRLTKKYYLNRVDVTQKLNLDL